MTVVHVKVIDDVVGVDLELTLTQADDATRNDQLRQVAHMLVNVPGMRDRLDELLVDPEWDAKDSGEQPKQPRQRHLNTVNPPPTDLDSVSKDEP